MDLMTRYAVSLLGALADFLMCEPVFYLFSIFCLIGIVKVFRAFLP